MSTESGGNSSFVDWGAFLRGALVGGVSEGVTAPTGSQAGSRGGNVGTAGALQYQDRAAGEYADDRASGFDMKTILIGGVVLLVGLVVVKKLL